MSNAKYTSLYIWANFVMLYDLAINTPVVCVIHVILVSNRTNAWSDKEVNTTINIPIFVQAVYKHNQSCRHENTSGRSNNLR